eukprot:scaffold1389_cov251-Ochromonas_danica.AAC.42
MNPLSPPPSSSSSLSKSKPVPPRADDADCKNCVGISIFTEKLRAQGRRPECYGIEYKSAKPVSAQQMAFLETLPSIEPHVSYYCFGISQSTTRMNRLGQPPIIKSGIRFEILTFTDNGNNDKSAMTQKVTASTATDSVSRPREDTLQKKKNEVNSDDISNLFAVKFGKQCQKGAASLVKMAENFDPVNATTKFYNSSVRLWDSCQRIIVVLSQKAIKKIKGSDDQGK